MVVNKLWLYDVRCVWTNRCFAKGYMHVKMVISYIVYKKNYWNVSTSGYAQNARMLLHSYNKNKMNNK